VKKNQPGLYAQVKNLPWRHIPAATRQRGRGHGREEHRTVKAAVAAGLCFPHAGQAICLTRRVRLLPVSGVPARLADQAKVSLSVPGVSRCLPRPGRSR
jgi:hypothetical protein